MSSLDPYKAALGAAMLLDRSSQGKIALAGADRVSFLHALLTNDIAALVPGTGAYSAYLTPQGRMISDMRIVETGSEILMEVEPSLGRALSERLDKLIFSEDVQVRDVTAELSELGIHGPAAAAVLERVTGIPASRLQSLKQYDNVRPPGSRLTIVRDDALGVPGFDVYMDAADAGRMASAIVEAGAAQGDDDTADILRVEAGRPRFLVDMDTETIPLEAGIEDRAISMTKGCYVGQEVIVRVLHRGHGRVAKRLVSMVLAGDRVPARGAAILAGSQDVGRITSAVRSPKLNAPVALGYVQREHAVVGMELQVSDGAELLQARVHQLCK